MRISATGNKTQAEGFTLVEVMTVVLILGLAASVVVLTLPRGEGPARAEAFALAERVRAAGEAAITTGTLGGLAADEDSYTFKAWRDGAWQEIALPGIGAAHHALAEEVSLEIVPAEEPTGGTAGTAGGERRFMLGTQEREALAEVPLILFSPGGEAAGFTASLDGPGRDWRVVAGPDGSIRVEAIDG